MPVIIHFPMTIGDPDRLANIFRDIIFDPPASGQEGSGPGVHQLCGKRCFYLDSIHVPNPGRTILPACHWLLYRIAMHCGDLRIHAEGPAREAEQETGENGRRWCSADRAGHEEARKDSRGRGCHCRGSTTLANRIPICDLRFLYACRPASSAGCHLGT